MCWKRFRSLRAHRYKPQIMHWRTSEMHRSQLEKRPTRSHLPYCKASHSLTLQNPGYTLCWRAMNVSSITNHTDPIVCVLVSCLCLMEKRHSFPPEQHLLVSHGRFLPSGCHANVEGSMRFLKYVWLEGKKNCVEKRAWEFYNLCVVTSRVLFRDYFFTKHHCLLHYHTTHAAVI